MPVRVLLIVIAATLVVACNGDEPTDTLRVSGHVEATEVQVAAEVGGRLLELSVGEGDRVKRGDVIARLDSRDTELQIAGARAERAAADAQMRLLLAGARAEDINQAEAQVEAAETEAGAAAAELKAAETDLERFES